MILIRIKIGPSIPYCSFTHHWMSDSPHAMWRLSPKWRRFVSRRSPSRPLWLIDDRSMFYCHFHPSIRCKYFDSSSTTPSFLIQKTNVSYRRHWLQPATIKCGNYVQFSLYVPIDSFPKHMSTSMHRWIDSGRERKSMYFPKLHAQCYELTQRIPNRFSSTTMISYWIISIGVHSVLYALSVILNTSGGISATSAPITHFSPSRSLGPCDRVVALTRGLYRIPMFSPSRCETSVCHGPCTRLQRICTILLFRLEIYFAYHL